MTCTLPVHITSIGDRGRNCDILSHSWRLASLRKGLSAVRRASVSRTVRAVLHLLREPRALPPFR